MVTIVPVIHQTKTIIPETNLPILEVKKSVTTLTQGGVSIPQRADACTFVVDVVAPTRCPGALGVRPRQLTTTTRLHKTAWARHLALHPDKQFADTILRYISEGVPIMYNGPEFSRICKNWDSTLTFKNTVLETIRADV